MTQVYTRPIITSLHERSYSYEGQQMPYSSKEGQEPKTNLLSRDSEATEGRGQYTQHPHSQMSNIGQGLIGAGELYQNPPEANQKHSRERLPSLSSLFGSTSHQSGPAQSPYSDRHSPIFPAAQSPHDARHSSTPLHRDRPFDGSYFQRLSQQHPSTSKKEHVERFGTAPSSRPAQTAVTTESSRYEARFSPAEASRNQTPSLNAWTPQPPSGGRSEYFPRDTSSSFRTHSDHAPPTHRPEPETRASYRDGSHRISVTPSFPPTPASTVIGELTTAKDGLGPKIWTGTQFLPRFVRQAEVPGEGMCYFYDDGTHCKTVIDGEAVNAHWGVTKAGKPRKRLAIACITCREKKIKCDPDYPRCVQCEKFGTLCKFKNAPRGGQGSPDTPPADPEDIVSRTGMSQVDAESSKAGEREASTSISPRPVPRVSPDSETHTSKRQRTSYNNFTPVPSEGSPRQSIREAESPAIAWSQPSVLAAADHDLLRDWQVNPSTVRPTVVRELVDVFFKHAPETTISMFPQGAFRLWFFSGKEKSLDDLMLVYTVLAVGTVFSLNQEYKALGAQYASISRYACENRRFSVQLVQSRLLLSLYYFAVNNPNDAWDFCGSAVRAASGLKLNVEIEKSEDAYLETFPYGLNRAGYAECRRRTFWSCYLMDRFNGFSSGRFSTLHPEDVFLRLPCDSTSFETQANVQNPFFDLTTPPIRSNNWTVGSIAYLINVATIWGDVMANIYRTSQRCSPSTPNSFRVFYEATTQRLHEWNDSLPRCYTFSGENLFRAAENGKMNIFVTMHMVYHATMIKLNRCIRRSAILSSQVDHHIKLAHQHAEALLRITDEITAHQAPSPSSPGDYTNSPAKLSTPFIGFSIVSAIDVLTAKFPLASVPNRLTSLIGAQSVLAGLATFWQSAKNQQDLVLERVRDLAELVAEQNDTGSKELKYGMMGATNQEGQRIFEMRDAMEKIFSRDYDCVYG